VAAKLAIGYHLDELKNDITGTSACFEPAVDYCVVKVPRFNFEKFAGADPQLGLQMRSVGETMALGGNFREALQKALRGLEIGLAGLEPPPPQAGAIPAALSRTERLEVLRGLLHQTGPERLLLLYEALLLGMDLEEARALTGIDPWFLLQVRTIAETERSLESDFAPLAAKVLPLAEDTLPAGRNSVLAVFLRRVKAQGFSDARIAALLRRSLPDIAVSEDKVRALRLALGVRPFFRCVDTCAGEFAALTPYFYSTFDAVLPDPAHAAQTAAAKAPPGEVEGRPLPLKVVILGGGPNRIGQGVEFDYCCVQAAFALREIGITAIMVNSNPETVSTDYDTADRLYFEPVTVEDVLAVCEAEGLDRSTGGVIVQFGGQTPLNIARSLEAAGVPILGTRPGDIALAEDREAFSALVDRLSIAQPASGMAGNEETACRVAKEIGYPVMIRPSFVLGGRSMRVIHRETDLRAYVSGREGGIALDPASPILVDKFLEDAVEVDVDAVCDGRSVTIAAVMEHIEQAGIHSGDSCCSIPSHTLGEEILERVRGHTRRLGLGLHTVGLLNVQFAVHRGEVYVLEANPRASRTVPFVSKATGCNVAGIAARIMAGCSLAGAGFLEEPAISYHAVKEVVIPFVRFPGAEISLGPEMRSTGEVMGIDRSFGMAFLKAQSATGSPIPFSGNAILSVTDRDKEALLPLAARLVALGFTLYATPGTLAVLAEKGIQAERVVKIGPRRPHLLDFMRNGHAHLMVNTVSGPASARDATVIRAEALARDIPLLTTLSALRAVVEGLETRRTDRRSVAPLQDYYAGLVRPGRRD
jgi:carbamoyl-phosphate synthase large subunit